MNEATEAIIDAMNSIKGLRFEKAVEHDGPKLFSFKVYRLHFTAASPFGKLTEIVHKNCGEDNGCRLDIFIDDTTYSQIDWEVIHKHIGTGLVSIENIDYKRCVCKLEQIMTSGCICGGK